MITTRRFPMAEAWKNIDAGDLVVIVGWAAAAFAANLRNELYEDQELTVLILRASEDPLPKLLQSAHETMATVIVIDPGTPEDRARELIPFADLVLRSTNPHWARVVCQPTRQTIVLRKGDAA
jgi:hypothetical protein